MFDRINQLTAVNQAQDQALQRILINTLEQNALSREEEDYLQSKISTNQRALIANLKLMITTVKAQHNQTLQQLSLDKLIINTCLNRSGNRIFRTAKMYLSRNLEGSLFITTYAEHAANTTISMLNQVIAKSKNHSKILTMHFAIKKNLIV